MVWGPFTFYTIFSILISEAIASEFSWYIVSNPKKWYESLSKVGPYAAALLVSYTILGTCTDPIGKPFYLVSMWAIINATSVCIFEIHFNQLPSGSDFDIKTRIVYQIKHLINYIFLFWTYSCLFLYR